MKKNFTYLSVIGLILSIFFNSSLSFGQNCKPDFEGVDRITKAHSAMWLTKIYLPPIGLVVNKTIEDVFLSIGKSDKSLALAIIVRVSYGTKSDYQLDTPLQGEKGKKMYLGFENGENLVLTVDDFANKNKVSNYTGIWNSKVDELVATTTFAANINEADLQKLKVNFNNAAVNYVRVELANGIYEKEITKHRAKNAKEKFQCFFNSLNGFTFSSQNIQDSKTTASAAPSPTITEKPKEIIAQTPTTNNNIAAIPQNKPQDTWVGKYKCDGGDVLTFSEDNAYSSEDSKGKVSNGKWEVNNQLLLLKKTSQTSPIYFDITEKTSERFVIRNYTLKKTITCRRTQPLEVTPPETMVVASSLIQKSTANKSDTQNLQNKPQNTWVGRYKCESGETLTFAEDNTYSSESLQGKISVGRWETYEKIFSLIKENQTSPINFDISEKNSERFVLKNYKGNKLITTISCNKIQPIESQASSSKVQKPSYSSPTNTSNFSIADEIKKMKDLLDAGIITKTEFEVQKKKLLEKQ